MPADAAGGRACPSEVATAGPRARRCVRSLETRAPEQGMKSWRATCCCGRGLVSGCRQTPRPRPARPAWMVRPAAAVMHELGAQTRPHLAARLHRLLRPAAAWPRVSRGARGPTGSTWLFLRSLFFTAPELLLLEAPAWPTSSQPRARRAPVARDRPASPVRPPSQSSVWHPPRRPLDARRELGLAASGCRDARAWYASRLSSSGARRRGHEERAARQ